MFVQAYETAPRRGASAHRGGGVAFVSMLTGQEWRPDNYDLMIVDMVDDYMTPRHRHNFDQVRVMLEGFFEWAPETPQPEGSVGYFAEGTYYTQKGIGPSRTLVLQVGGASGSGYTSNDQLQKGIAELKADGAFNDGIYTRIADNGTKINLDGYQAVWEHVHGRQLAYPEPRFQTPVIAFPDAFAWLPAGEGAFARQFGIFNERGTSVGQIKIAAGGHAPIATAAENRTFLFFVVAGSGNCDGTAFGTNDAIRVDCGETVVMTASTPCLLYKFGLPKF